MKAEVDLVDIGGGNTGSVRRCLERIGLNYKDVNAQAPPDGSRPLLVPGVGAFGAVMDSLDKSGLSATLRRLVQAGTPYLGICIGMQILFDESEESPDCPGLGLLNGKVVRYQHHKVPQMGWNKITAQREAWEDGFVYFVNSYVPVPDEEGAVLYEAEYGGTFCAAVAKDNITAFQFHPEKSGPFGERLLKRWVSDGC